MKISCHCAPAFAAALAALVMIAAAASAQDPGVQWKRGDWYLIHPDSGWQTQEESGEDWWFDHVTSYADGEVNGFIAAGYSSFVNYVRSEAATNGCQASSLGAPACWELETPGNVNGDALATMALVAKDGGSLEWYRTYHPGWFHRVIQTSDGGYLAVGLTTATRAASGAPLFYNPDQSAGETTDQFDDGVACTRECDPSEGCVEPSIPDHAACNDGNSCTTDTCTANGCVSETAANGTACDDGDACTPGGDVCQAGECVGSSLLCCDDADPCTVDSCDPDVGCLHEETASAACPDAR